MSWPWRTLVEPFRVKAVERLSFTTRAQREAALAEAGYDLLRVPADRVLVDLVTDSGNAAMSSDQWSAVMRADESSAGGRSYLAFEKRVRELTGLREVVAAPQGRAAWRGLLRVLSGPGKTVLSNALLDTTRAGVEAAGAEAVDLPVPEAADPRNPGPFKGDVDTRALEAEIRERGPKNVPLVVLTATNEAVGGQPVSMRNFRDAAAVCGTYNIPLFIDGARFAENAYLIKRREPGYATRPVAEIAAEMFSYAAGCLMSGRKDAFANAGGFLALNDAAWARRARAELAAGDGATAHGGLAGRDLEALARGLEEALDEDYLQYRVRSVDALADGLRSVGVPLVEPPGGHAVYVDAAAFVPHIPAEQFPAQALACDLYLTAGIRAAELGSFSRGRRTGGKVLPDREWLRLAVPRRVYTQSHLEFVVEVFGDVARRRDTLRGLRRLESADEPTLQPLA